MTAPDSRAADFTPSDAEYRPISRLAIASLILGLASLAALAHPVLWIVPVTGIVLAVVALRQIAASPETLPGKSLAQIGLGLACLFASWGTAWYLADHFIIAQQARRYGESWLRVLSSGRVYEAHQLTLPAPQRVKNQKSLAELYNRSPEMPLSKEPRRSEGGADANVAEDSAEQELAMKYRQFITESPMKELLQIGAGWRFAFVRTVSRTSLDLYTTYVTQEYEIQYAVNEQPRSLRIELTMQRTCMDRTAQWNVDRVSSPER